MKLLIVESPAKAKTISKYLDGKYKVVASIGHIRDLPKSNKKAIDIEGGFIPHYEISKGKEGVVADIQALAKQADEILLATDPDREGEAIAWHIAQATHLKNPKRVVFHEITKEAVQEAVAHPRHIDNNLKLAQEARRVLDRLVGYDLSGLIWKKVRYGLSAGRVQSPALRILMEREREIRAFISHKFWVITADVENNPKTATDKKEKFVVTCSEEPTDFKKVEEILALGKKEVWKVSDIKETEAKRAPKAPFITSTLQQTASSRLGFAPSRTMMVAQKLYEAGHITYMRTDSTNLSQLALGQAAQVIEKKFGKEYLEHHTFDKKSKNAQEAHEAIRPTSLFNDHAGNTPEQKKLYELIWKRTVASQMKDAKTLRTRIAVQVGDGKAVPDFQVNGTRVLYEGWLKADPEARGEDVEVPKVIVGEMLNMLDMHTEEKETQPPARYSEAGLIKELEKRGIGRPSTYASIIKTIVDRGYVEKIDRALKPTDTGDVVSSFLETNFTDYISDSFTAEMEDKLDAIARGEMGYEKTLSDFYKPFTKEVKSKDKMAKLTTLGDAPPGMKCPKCGKDMVVKLGRGGKFLSCSTFPDCTGALTMEGLEIKADEPIGTDPVSGHQIFVKIGRFGPYVQLGEKTKEHKKPKMASIPKEKDPTKVTQDEALHYLSLPRVLGNHPDTNEPITANIGRFGPYVVHQKDFRSLKVDDVYKIELPRALEIFKEEKKKRGFAKKKKAE